MKKCKLLLTLTALWMISPSLFAKKFTLPERLEKVANVKAFGAYVVGNNRNNILGGVTSLEAIPGQIPGIKKQLDSLPDELEIKGARKVRMAMKQVDEALKQVQAQKTRLKSDPMIATAENLAKFKAPLFKALEDLEAGLLTLAFKAKKTGVLYDFLNGIEKTKKEAVGKIGGFKKKLDGLKGKINNKEACLL